MCEFTLLAVLAVEVYFYGNHLQSLPILENGREIMEMKKEILVVGEKF